jgi:hypothetical protein
MNRNGIRVATDRRMRPGPLTRTVVILVFLMTGGVRAHAHAFDPPDALAQDLNRCMSLVRIAASRRSTPVNPRRRTIRLHTR